MLMPCLHTALLSPGEAESAAALFAEGQSSCKKPLHENLLDVNTCCKKLHTIMPPLLGRGGHCAVRWRNAQLAKVTDNRVHREVKLNKSCSTGEGVFCWLLSRFLHYISVLICYMY